MYNKLQANRDRILRPVLDDLASLRYLQEQGNAERVTMLAKHVYPKTMPTNPYTHTNSRIPQSKSLLLHFPLP